MVFTLQVTLLLEEPVTVVVNCSVAPVWTVAEVGEMETTTPAAVIVTVAEPDCVVSWTLVAVTVTGLVLGIELGAV
jgi:hypothetical protein